MKQRILIAIGGNAISREGERGTIEEMMRNLETTMDPVVGLLDNGYDMVVTHGNGPQVGNAMIKEACASYQVPAYPLDVLNASTQGTLGYMISQTLQNKLKARGISRPIATVLTQVVVDRNDERFQHPSKPVGPFYTREIIEAHLAGNPDSTVQQFVEDSGRGWRRVVPSPLPLDIIEREAIETLLGHGFLVIAGGGGGIPVVRENGTLHGVEAVIDKDFASALIAAELKADYYVILTGVEKVAINFGKPDQKNLDVLTVSEARSHLHDGQFPRGSMGPKIEAALYFLEKGGNQVLITSLAKVREGLAGETGTRIVPDRQEAR